MYKKNKDSGFSGLEAAIVLIAFVVVAAVFSYVMLGAGFFATQKSQEVTYSGLKQTTSNMVLDGQVYGDYTAAALGNITFYLTVPEGGQAQALDLIAFLVTINEGAVEDLSGGATFDPTDNVLKPGNKVEVSLDLTEHSDTPPTAGESFTLEIKPNVGASSFIQKTLTTGYSGGVII